MAFNLTNTQAHIIPHQHPTSDITGLVELIQANAVVVSPTAPANPGAGKLWYNTTKGVFNIWNGSAWILVGPEICPLTKAQYDSLSAADKADGRFYLITDNDGTIYVEWENIDGKPYYISSTTPSTPAEGYLWYDTTDDVLKFYDGTNWNPVNTNTEYTGGTNVSVDPVTHEISATDTTYVAGDFDIKDLADSTDLRTTWSGKQDAINDLQTIRSGAAAGATAVQPLDNVSGLTNDAGYITNAVSDLTNYYTKTQTYTKAEVDQMISDFGGFEVVEQLPAVATANPHIIYLLGPIGTGGDQYEEWIVTESCTGAFESESTINHESISYSTSAWGDIIWNSDSSVTNVYVGVNNAQFGDNTHMFIDDYGSSNSESEVNSGTTMPLIGMGGYMSSTPGLYEVPMVSLYGDNGVSFDLYYSDSELTWNPSAVCVKQWTKIGETSVDLSNYFNTFTDTADSITAGSTNLFVTSSEKSTWSGKQDALVEGTGIDINSSTNEISVDTTAIATKTDLNSYIPRSSGQSPDTLSDTSVYYGQCTDDVSGTFTDVTISSGDVSVAEKDASNPAQNYHKAELEIYNNTADVFVRDVTPSGANYAMYKSNGIEARGVGATKDTYLFQGGGDNQIARLGDINTKTFPMAVATKVADAQAAIDWVLDGNNALIKLDNRIYLLDKVENGVYYFKAVAYSNNGTNDTMTVTNIEVTVVSDTVTEVHIMGEAHGYLETNRNYSTPFIPTQPGHPATKKYVDDNVIQKSAVAPSNPTEGTVWYDTTNDVLKVYDGTNWNVTGKTYTAGTNIDIANDVISADTQFVVVDTLPSVATADVNKVYILGPIGTGADKYEEWIVSDHGEPHFVSESTIDHESIDFTYDGLQNFGIWNGDGTIQNKYIGITNLQLSTSNRLVVVSDNGASCFCCSVDNDSEMPFIGNGPDCDSTEGYDNPYIFYSDMGVGQSGETASFDLYYSDTPLTWVAGGKEWIKIGETSSDLSNYLAKDNTTSYTPSGDYNPATKKYVDDRAVPTSGTTGYILTKTANGYEWAAAPSSGKYDIVTSSDAPSDHTVLWIKPGTSNTNDEMYYYDDANSDWVLMGGVHKGADMPSADFGREGGFWLKESQDGYPELLYLDENANGWVNVGGTYIDSYPPSSGNIFGRYGFWYDTVHSELKYYDHNNGWTSFWGVADADSVSTTGNFFAKDSSNQVFYYESGLGWNPIGGIIYADYSTDVPEDKLWYDKRNDVFKYYNQSTSSWEEVTKIYTPGDGIDIDTSNNNEISVDVSDFAGAGLTDDGYNNLAVDTTVIQEKLTAGTGINISNQNVISADTTVLATKSDIAKLGSFEVVDTLPSAATADEKTIYLLGPIGTGADKYEEWIVTETEGTISFEFDDSENQYNPNTITFSSSKQLTISSYDNTTHGNNANLSISHKDSNTGAYDYFSDYADEGQGFGRYDCLGGMFPVFIDANTITIPAGTYDIHWGGMGAPFDSITFTDGTSTKSWTKIGETSIDLSGYATTSAMNTALATKADVSDLNTKTFYLTGTTGQANIDKAQAALDWYLAGKNPIIVYSDKAYILYWHQSNSLRFRSMAFFLSKNGATTSTMLYNEIQFTIDSSTHTVTEIYAGNVGIGGGQDFLATGVNYEYPYTPEYDGSPATKKYVDDNVVQKSSTAPSSPTEGMVWYDTTNDVLKVYDGTNWNEVGSGGAGDMLYADFNWSTKSGASITLDLNTTIEPTANFTVNAPATIKDGQIYVLRVQTGVDAYTMTLGTNITNPYNEDLTLSINTITQFSFVGINNKLELQPSIESASYTAGDGIDITNGTVSVDVTDIIGTGLSEDASNNIIVDTTVVATQTDLSGKQDKATSGSTAPATTPSYVGQQYVDTTNGKLYVALGTSSSSDWMEVGAGGSNVVAITQQEYDALTPAEKNDGKFRIITDSPSETLPFVEEMDDSPTQGIKIWAGTQAQYNNLQSVDPSGVYIILSSN